MNTDQLFLVSTHLREQVGLAGALNSELRTILATPEYLFWGNSVQQARPFVLAEGAPVPALESVGLVDGGVLAVRVNLHHERVFITDGVWAPADFRAFPFHDESRALLACASETGWLQRAGVLYDLAGGVGHSALACSRPLQVLLDINPRALAYAEVNKLINGLDPARYLSILNDIRTGVPSGPALASQAPVLVLANMPFAPAPARGDLPMTSNGGVSGLDLQLATFRALQKLRAEVPDQVPIQALVMGMTLGDARAGRWELEDLAASIFGRSPVRWHLQPEEPLARVDGARKLENPSPVTLALPALAECTLYGPDVLSRAKKRIAFSQLAAQHAAAGNPDIAYGIVSVEL